MSRTRRWIALIFGTATLVGLLNISGYLIAGMLFSQDMAWLCWVLRNFRSLQLWLVVIAVLVWAMSRGEEGNLRIFAGEDNPPFDKLMSCVLGMIPCGLIVLVATWDLRQEGTLPSLWHRYVVAGCWFVQQCLLTLAMVGQTGALWVRLHQHADGAVEERQNDRVGAANV